MFTLIRKIIIVLAGISLALLITVLLLDPFSVSVLALNINLTSVLIRLPAAILIDLIVLAVVVVLVRSERVPRPASTGLMVKAQGAIADVSVESARERILRAVRAVPDVLAAEADVKAIRGRADVDLDVSVSKESTSLPDKQREIDRALRQVINKELGLQMAGQPRVHIRMGNDEKLFTSEPSAAIPAATTVTPPVGEALPAPVAQPEPKVETAEPFPVKDTMTLRRDEDTKPET